MAARYNSENRKHVVFFELHFVFQISCSVENHVDNNNLKRVVFK